LNSKTEEVNEVQAGYFKNIVENLHNQKAAELYLYFFEQPELADNYMNHLSSKSICESFIKFVSINHNPNSNSNNYYFDDEPDIKEEKEIESPYTIYLEKRMCMLHKI